MNRLSRTNLLSDCMLALAAIGIPGTVFSAQLDIPGPAGSAMFGAGVVALPNGNFVVIDP